MLPLRAPFSSCQAREALYTLPASSQEKSGSSPLLNLLTAEAFTLSVKGECLSQEGPHALLPTFKATSGCPGRSKPGWLCVPSSILPGPEGSVRGRVDPEFSNWLNFVSQQLPGRCSWLSLKALAAVESFICSGARIISVLQVQNS